MIFGYHRRNPPKIGNRQVLRFKADLREVLFSQILNRRIQRVRLALDRFKFRRSLPRLFDITKINKQFARRWRNHQHTG